MIERLSKLIALFSFTALVGCMGTSEKSITYFGGKIINPKANFVVLFDNEVVLDTFFLDQDDRFLGEVKFLNEGLYYFKHGNEHQYIYLEPKDSLLIRLNTWDFDESLVFSGKGAERNNLLIDCFLESEKDKRIFYSFYEMSPNHFKEKVDSIIKRRLITFKEFETNNPQESEEYKNILKIALTYPLYAKVENYPIAHIAMSHDEKHKEVTRDFYTHRDMVDMNNDSIMYFYAYRDLVVSHLYNKVSTAGHHHESDEFTISLLRTIANELKNEDTRNVILRQTVIGHFYRKSSCNVNTDAFDTYFQLSSNEKDKKMVMRLLNDSKQIHKGKKLHNFHITDYNRTDRPIKSIIKGKHSVVYFWNPEYMSREFIASRIGYLSREYPDVEFIGVKIDGKADGRIKRLDIKSQYYISPKSEAHEFLTSKMPRTILVDEKGVVTNGYASLSSPNIYAQIAEMVNK